MNARALRRLASLSAADALVLAEAWLRFAWVDLHLRLRGYAHWRHWLEPLRTPRRPPRGRAGIARLIRLSERAARHHWAPMNCLRRSLVQRQLLARRGIDAQLQIGVRSGPGGLQAHAWLTHAGRPLNDSARNLAGYRVLAHDPGGGPATIGAAMFRSD